MLKLLTFTSLFPNPAQPRLGVFVENRLRHLLNTGEVETKVVAPVPWYPEWAPALGRYARYKDIPKVREQCQLEIRHPKYPVIPAVGMSLAPALMAASVYSTVRCIFQSGYQFDLIDAHYFYPDGVAAARISDRLGVPLVITARGTDINLIPQYRIPRRQIMWAAQRAEAIVTVCDALRDRLIQMGVDEGKITTLRNGVDPAIFSPVERATARKRLGVSGRTLLSIGHLIERKGHHLIIEAMPSLPEYKLIIVGAGEWEAKLRKLVTDLDLENRARFVGEVPQSELKYYYSACDATVLASSREGMANVLLESIACGCPLIATNVGGTSEIIRHQDAGLLITERTSQAISGGVRDLFEQLPERARTQAYSRNFDWEPTTEGQLRVFRSILARRENTARKP